MSNTQKDRILAIIDAPRQVGEDIQTMLGQRLRAIRDVIDPESKVAREQEALDFVRRYRESATGPSCTQ